MLQRHCCESLLWGTRKIIKFLWSLFLMFESLHSVRVRKDWVRTSYVYIYRFKTATQKTIQYLSKSKRQIDHTLVGNQAAPIGHLCRQLYTKSSRLCSPQPWSQLSQVLRRIVVQEERGFWVSNMCMFLIWLYYDNSPLADVRKVASPSSEQIPTLLLSVFIRWPERPRS